MLRLTGYWILLIGDDAGLTVQGLVSDLPREAVQDSPSRGRLKERHGRSEYCESHALM